MPDLVAEDISLPLFRFPVQRLNTRQGTPIEVNYHAACLATPLIGAASPLQVLEVVAEADAPLEDFATLLREQPSEITQAERTRLREEVAQRNKQRQAAEQEVGQHACMHVHMMQRDKHCRLTCCGIHAVP